MGDRRQVILDYSDSGKIYLYSHWHGSDLLELTANALKQAKPRWSDVTYCARIIITSIIHETGQCCKETGWGIAPYHQDSEHEDIVIHLDSQQVSIGSKTLTFNSFLAIYGSE
jgi:hypothetical protein